MKIWKKNNDFIRIVSLALTIMIFFQSIPVYAQENTKWDKESSKVLSEKVQTSEVETVSNPEEIPEQGGSPNLVETPEQGGPPNPEETPEQEGSQNPEETPEQGGSPNPEETPEQGDVPQQDGTLEQEETPESEGKPVPELYQDSRIKIYHLSQLEAIGTGSVVTDTDLEEETFGNGEHVSDGGQEVTYSLDAAYELMNDIPLNTENLWMLPEDFTGSFTGEPAEDAPLYDAETDTVYIYNNYQLMLLASDNGGEEPIMSNDMIPEKIGVGKLLYPDGRTADSKEEAEGYLTYSREHNYVLSRNFTEKMPELEAAAIADGIQWLEGEEASGRTQPGQLTYDIGGETYILIGNESQLRAIGTDKHVTPRLYIFHEPSLVGSAFVAPYYIPYYPGDADLGLEAVATQSATTHTEGVLPLDKEVMDRIDGDTYNYYKQEGKGKYELANLDVSDSGILGGLLEALGGILGSLLGGTNKLCGVNENGLPDYETMGDHELAKLYGGLKYSDDANYIIFRDIDLSANGAHSDKKDTLWTPIHFSGKMEGRLELNPGKAATISNIQVEQTGLLNMETTSGIGFFGTISNKTNEELHSAGRVSVKNLHLDHVTVDNQSSEVDKNVDSLVEGLLGVLGGILGGIVDIITGILPIFRDLTLGKLIKDLLTLKQNSPDLFATGSFAGRIVGDVSVEGCIVTNASVTSVRGMTGGFVGYTEGVVKYDGLSGLLSAVVKVLSTLLNILPGVGLGDLITILLENDIPLGNLIPVGYYNPVIMNSSVALSKATIGTSQWDYNGGFVGVQTATKIRSCSVANLGQVQAKNGAGGFAGIERDAVIKGLLNDLGVQLYTLDIRSEQTACTVSGTTELTVEAKKSYAGGMNGAMANSLAKNCAVTGIKSVTAGKYAGGFAGRATIGYGTAVGGTEEWNKTLLDAVSELLAKVVASGNEDQLNTLLSVYGVTPSEIYGCTVAGSGLQVNSTGDYAGGLIGQGDGTRIKDNTKVTGLTSVNAENYAGGLAGSISTADGIGVLNQTVGVAQYIPFEIRNTSVEGTDFTVTASKKYAAGGVGLMLGGEAEQVQIKGISKIETGNYAGGFAGRMGTASLAAAGGLNILGLIQVNNVLSLAQGVRVKVDTSQVLPGNGGLAVLANGTADLQDGESITAGGFVAESVASKITDCKTDKLRLVEAKDPEGKDAYAGGFVGRSHTGGLAGLAQEQEDGSLKLPEVLKVDSLLALVPYLMPKYINTTVTFVSNGENPQVISKCAGGFAGAMQAGTVDNSTLTDSPYAVYELENVKGKNYAGGFAGKVDAGAVAASKGLGLLNGIIGLQIGDLLNVLSVYIPEITSAGVKSAEKGFTVEATAKDSSAGGYIGYGSGVQIKKSDVTSLKYTPVTPPADSLESQDGSSYFGQSSSYAVKGGQYAGGYIGCADIDSAAAVGGGLSLLGGLLNLDNVLSALDAVCTTIEDSDVNGSVGGFSVLADGKDDKNAVIGKAGGYAGKIAGTIIKKSDVHQFAYIIGQEMAGGYVGEMEPGDVASVLEDGKVLDGLLNVGGSLASLVNSFIPIIEDSSTDSVPCGGAVRAQGTTDMDKDRGMAGGYVGYNHGGRIEGKAEECAAIRIRSVYGGESAGGFTGWMETASLASTGKLKLLFGLVSVDNVLGLLGAVYPTETNTGVYGPLRQVSIETWNAWAKAVASGGVYGYQFPTKEVASQEELNQLIQDYAYGYNVKSGRTSQGSLEKQSGTAGGYVGTMKGGVVTEAHAWDARYVTAYTAAGGFSGEMITGGVAEVGGVSLLKLPITGSLSAVQTFVPVIRNSDITGFQSGMQVKATGIPQKANDLKIEKAGYAGGFVGHMLGGQIWGNWNTENPAAPDFYSATDAVPDPQNNRCFTANLRKVEGTNAIGGFAGRIDPASAAALDTAGSEGLLGGLLQNLITTPGDLLSVLNTTLATVRAADVKAWDEWGIVIQSAYQNGTNTSYGKAAGGFAGEINGAVIGKKDNPESGCQVENIRSVTGGEYAGGFFGLADVSAVAEISGDGNTSILAGLLNLESADVLDAFRTYIYDSKVTGASNAGLEVYTRDSKKYEYVNNPVYSGNAGGFGGALLNGSVKNSQVTNLRYVEGCNYTGGFIGHLGKSGTVDLDNLGVFDKLANLGIGVLDIFGSHVDDSSVAGVSEGFTVKSSNLAKEGEKEEITGGFTGYADLARLNNNQVTNLKQVASSEIAGGFAGKTSFAYLINTDADSPLVQVLLDLLNKILKALWVKDLEEGNIIKIDLGLITVDALYEGNLVHLNLLGLDISIALAKDQQLATVYIGDSKIEINCAEDGSITNGDAIKNEIHVSLIKANRTRIDGCTVTGIAQGYDVYGGGAGNDRNGEGQKGYAGGFVGLNNEGLLKNNQMYLADVVRGTREKTGPFTGASSLESNWDFNTVYAIEGENNHYRIYREPDAAYKDLKKGSTVLQHSFESTQEWNIYDIQHMEKGKVEKFKDLENAVMSNGTERKDLLAYMENGAMAVLMDNTPTQPTQPGEGEPEPDVQDPCKDVIELTIRKIWKGDEEKDRPESIQFLITRTYEKNGATITDDTFKEEVILSKEDAQSSDTWEKILSGEKYTAYKLGDNDEKYYYTYHVSEDGVPGYETTIKGDGTYNYTITITNKKNWFDSILPETGGFGPFFIYGIGILLLAAYGVMLYRKKANNRNCYK